MSVRIIVMGISGCGKTSVATAAASSSGAIFIEGDDLHPPENKTKMAAGIPLTDAERIPWLHAIIERANRLTDDVVITCSSLKRAYRDLFRSAWGRRLRFIYLDCSGVPDEVLSAGMASRKGHFFDPSLLSSQRATLEIPTCEEKSDVWRLIALSDGVKLRDSVLLCLEVLRLEAATEARGIDFDFIQHMEDGSVTVSQGVEVHNEDVSHEAWSELPDMDDNDPHQTDIIRTSESLSVLTAVVCGDKASGKTTLCHSLASGDTRVLQVLRYSHAKFANVWHVNTAAELRDVINDLTASQRDFPFFQSELAYVTLTVDNAELRFFLEDEAFQAQGREDVPDLARSSPPSLGHTVLHIVDVGSDTLDALMRGPPDSDNETQRGVRSFLRLATSLCYFVNASALDETALMRRVQFLRDLSSQARMSFYVSRTESETVCHRIQSLLGGGSTTHLFGPPDVPSALRMLYRIASQECLPPNMCSALLVHAALDILREDCEGSEPLVLSRRALLKTLLRTHDRHGGSRAATSPIHPLGGVPAITLIDCVHKIADMAVQQGLGVPCSHRGEISLRVERRHGVVTNQHNSESDPQTSRPIRLCGHPMAVAALRRTLHRAVLLDKVSWENEDTMYAAEALRRECFNVIRERSILKAKQLLEEVTLLQGRSLTLPLDDHDIDWLIKNGIVTE